MTGISALAARMARRLGGWRTVLGLTALLAAVLSCFPRILSSEWVLFSRDIHAYWYPMVATFVRVVFEGSLPLWDPYEAYGLPLWSDPGAQVAYPPTWLNLLLLPQTVYKLLVLGHLMWGGAGVFALARRWRMGALPATAAAVTFACAGPVVSAGSLIHHLCGVAWMPWVLWAFEGVLARGSRKDVALLALALGFQGLAGSAETCAMAVLAAALRWLTSAAGRWGGTLARTGALAAAAGTAGLLMAVQWVPTLAILGRTSRMLFPPESKLFWSVHPLTLADALVPRLISEISMGNPVREVLYGSREPFIMSLYLGVATLPLVLLSLRSERPQRWWAWLSFAFFLALALGQHFAPSRLLLALPPLSLFRYPSKYLWAAALAWSTLVGLGADVWWRAGSRGDCAFGRVVGALLLAAAAGLALAAQRVTAHPGSLAEAFEIAEQWRAWMAVLAGRKLYAAAGWLCTGALLLLVRAWRPEWARVSAVAAALLAAADLSVAARPVNPLAPAALMTHRPPLLAHLLPETQPSRLLSTGASLAFLNQDMTRGPAGWEPEWRWTLGLQEMVSPPLGSRWNLRGSYDGDFTGLAPPWQDFMSRLVTATAATPLALRLMQMGNVGWVIDPRPGAFRPLPEVAQSQSVFSHPLRLYRVPEPMPPCYVVGSATRADSDEDAARRIASPDFDPWGEVVLSGEGPRLAPPPGFRGTALYRVRRANLLRIETETSAPAVLVASEGFDPDWRATVDGVPVAVERANVLFRGVRVPAGRHVVELAYSPRSVPWGAGATVLGLAIVGLLLRRGDRTFGGARAV